MRLFACTIALLALASTVVPVRRTVAAPAEVERTMQFGVVLTACTGEFITTEETVTLVTKQNNDDTFTSHVSIHGTAIGTSGTEYVLTAQLKQTNTESDVVLTVQSMWVSKGPEPNQHIVTHVNTATGEVTEKVVCPG